MTPPLSPDGLRVLLDGEATLWEGRGLSLYDVGWSLGARGLRFELRAPDALHVFDLVAEDVPTRSARRFALQTPSGARPSGEAAALGGLVLDVVERSDAPAVFAPRPTAHTPFAHWEPAVLSEAGALSAWLSRDFDAYERLYSARPALVRSAREPRALSVWYPAPSNHRRPTTGAPHVLPRPLAERRVFREYIARLGFDIDGDASVRTAPLPTDFPRLVESLLGRAAPLIPVAHTLVGLSMSPEDWVASVLGGHLPISATGSLGARLYRRAPDRVVDLLPRTAGMLPHDVGLHLFVLHRVPRATLVDLLRPFMQSPPRGREARRLATFVEEDLTRTCQAIWGSIPTPAAFDDIFAKTLPSLRAQLARSV